MTFLLGGLIAWAATPRIDVTFLLPFAAGNFLYIAASDLIPEVRTGGGARAGLTRLIAFGAGIGLLYLLRVTLES